MDFSDSFLVRRSKGPYYPRKCCAFRVRGARQKVLVKKKHFAEQNMVICRAVCAAVVISCTNDRRFLHARRFDLEDFY